jgi:hypothetical protein
MAVIRIPFGHSSTSAGAAARREMRRPVFEAQIEAAPVAPCFAAGTLILTEQGETRVEELVPDDVVILAEGEMASVLAIKLYAFEGLTAPVRIAAGGLATGVPERDLVVSPDHGVYFDGSLVAAKELVDGVVIRPLAAAGDIRFFTLELVRHGIVLAEGAALESFSRKPVVASRVKRDGGGFTRVTKGEALAGIRARLHARKLMLGYTVMVAGGIELEVRGEALAPVGSAEGRVSFALPAGTVEAAVKTATFVPAETDPSSTDRRVLGIAMTEILYDGRAVDIETVCAPETVHRPGPAETATWTRGAARIAVTPGTQVVSIQVAEWPKLWVKP